MKSMNALALLASGTLLAATGCGGVDSIYESEAALAAAIIDSVETPMDPPIPDRVEAWLASAEIERLLAQEGARIRLELWLAEMEPTEPGTETLPVWFEMVYPKLAESARIDGLLATDAKPMMVCEGHFCVRLAEALLVISPAAAP